MNKRRLERVAVMILSIAMLLSSTGIMSSLAANVGESTSAQTSSVASTDSTTVKAEGGSVMGTTVAEEGGSLVTSEDGDGTVENPYKISDADDLLNMQNLVNLTTSSNKNFVLTSDIDLSSVNEDSFKKNGGSLVAINKSLASSSENVFFTLDGNGHKISGLSVKADSSESISIFGYVNSKSTIKNLVVENPQVTSKSDKLAYVAVISSENNGTITGVTVKNPVITVEKCGYLGVIAAVNRGTISDVTVKGVYSNAGQVDADKHNISANGIFGSVAGLNSGKISSVSSINFGAYIPDNDDVNSVCGGIAGQSSGSIANTVATGPVCGGKASDVVGGLVGKADDGLKLKNSYALVSLSKTAQGAALIGSAGTDEMVDDCFWSSNVSKRSTAVTNAISTENNIITNSFKVVQVGKSVTVSESDVKKFAWGKAVFGLDGEFTSNNSNVKAISDSTAVTVKGEKADTISTITYVSDIALPANVGAGNGSVTLKQYMNIYVLTVPEDTNGNGTKDSPLEISNSAEFAFLNYANGIYCTLTKDIVSNGTGDSFCGTLDGCGHTVSTEATLFNAVRGNVKNLNVAVTGDITRAVFANVCGADMSGVSVAMKDGVKLNATASNVGIFANKIIDNCTLDDCRVKGDISVNAEKLGNIGGFAGVVAGEGTTITNSGAAVNVSGKTASAANLIGTISAENVTLKNCYVAGANKCGDFMFADTVNAKKINVTDNYIDYSDDNSASKKALDFEKYNVSEDAFNEWKFDDEVGFFTGNGGSFTATVPEIKSMQNSTASDYTLSFDASRVNATVKVEDGKLVLNVTRANGVVTVKALPITVTNEKTGLSATICVSNGLEKDSNGNLIVTTAYDLAYISENIDELASASFVVNSDIDMSAITSFAPIGSTAVAFSGSFNGNGHTISNLTINGTSKVALFGALDGATVKNIRFAKASVSSDGGYSSVLAGKATGKTVISDITVVDSTLNVNENYSAAIVASVDSDVKISNVTVDNVTIKSSASYVGAVAGYVAENAEISDVTVNKLTVSGANYVSGVVGCADSANAVVISDVSVSNSDISGVSEISGIASGIGTGVTIKNADVKSSKIYTIGSTSAFTAGGISAVYGSLMENVSVSSVEISAGVVGGIVGKASENCTLSIKSAKVEATKIVADGENTVGAGILGTINSNGTAILESCVVDSKTEISGAVASGAVGDCTGLGNEIAINNVKTFANVNGTEIAAGLLARIGTSAINGISIDNSVSGGVVYGSNAVGGIIGLVKGGEAYNGKNVLVANTVAYAMLTSKTDAIGMIIGATETKKVITSSDLDKAINNVIISTYYGDVTAYSDESGLAGGKYVDIDKPNGSNITANPAVLSTSAETDITINNLPNVDGYSFDNATGWVSESEERIQVVSSKENTAVLKANHMADISVVGYYVSESDNSVNIPVHFRMVSDIRTPLKGSGTKDAPYLVYNAYDLETVAQYESDGVYFALADDITFTADDFEFGGAFYNVGNGVVTIGDVTNGFKGNFSGLYNGKVHSITGLAVAGNAFGGLFGATDGAVISDLIINNADISGLNYAGVVAGSAKNTTIKNITINSAKVEATELGGYVGTVVGYAENTTINDVSVNGAKVSTIAEADIKAVEFAGGVAGIFDGVISNVTLDDVAINSAYVAGGAVGAVRDSAEIKNVEINADINAQLVGGVVGVVENPLTLSINGCNVIGSLNGEKENAGVIGKISDDDNNYNVNKADASIVSDTLIVADIAKSEICGIIVGDVSDEIINDSENGDVKIFDKVYYSSYQNDIGLFGNEEVNAYQGLSYNVIDLSGIKYFDGNAEREYLPLSTTATVLSDNSIKLNGADGNYKSFTVNGKAFELANITGDNSDVLTYDAENNSLKLNSALDREANAVFNYNDGLRLAIKIAQNTKFNGLGTAEAPYEINNADDFNAMLANADAQGVYYKLCADIKLNGVASAELFAGVLDGNGYVLYDYTGTSLFARVTGEIKNTGFVGFNVADNHSVAVGAVAGVLDGGKISDCFVIAKVTANGGRQDVGALAGRATNGAQIVDVLTSGKVVAENELAVGGVVGSVIDSSIKNAVSTAYVNGSNTVGGIVGETEKAEIDAVIFGNMVESASSCGNIIGKNDNESTVSKAYYDSSAVRTANACGSGAEIKAEALTTAQLKSLDLNGFASLGGYPIAEKLTKLTNAKFVTGVTFASMTINYLAGLNAGTACNYTDITAETKANGNDVILTKDNGITLKLAKTADYANAENEIVRFTNPLSTSSVDISTSFVDATSGKLGNKLVGILLKSKVGETSSAFDFFTKANGETKNIGAVVVTDGLLYVNAELPQGVKFNINAVDENGNSLNVTDAKNEGKLIATADAKAVSITITAENDTEETWGLRSIWGVIGK